MHRRGSLLSGADRCVAGWRGVIGAGFGGVVSARAQARQLPGPASAAAGEEEEEVAEPAPLPLTELLLRELEAYCKQPLLASEGDDPESGGGAGVCSPDGARRRLALLAGLARGCHGREPIGGPARAGRGGIPIRSKPALHIHGRIVAPWMGGQAGERRRG